MASHPPQREDHDGGGELGVLRLLDLEDRRLQAAAFLMATGSCVVLYGAMPNRSANADHVLAGFLLFITGAALALLTLGGAGTGRAAARLEEALRGFF